MSAPVPLDDRYGRSTRSARGRRVVIATVSVVGALALASWFLWANPLEIGPSATARDIGHRILDNSHVEVQFEATVTPGHPFACAIEAMNSSFAVVGWKVIAYPASTTLTTSFTEIVKTTEPAVTGLVANCCRTHWNWLYRVPDIPC